MGFAHWRPRKDPNPTDFARDFAPGLLLRIEDVAASLVAFSGKRIFDSEANARMVAFQNSPDLEDAGFRRLTKDVARLVAPNIEELRPLADPGFLTKTFAGVAGFLYACSCEVANECMSPERVAEFSEALLGFVGEGVAQHLVDESTTELRTMMEHFRSSCRGMVLLDFQAPGESDCFAILLKAIAGVGPGGAAAQYAFVVGSREQTLGCLPAVGRALGETRECIRAYTTARLWGRR